MKRLGPRHARRSNRRSPILTATAGNTVEVAAAAGGGGGIDANTLFLARFQVSPPVNEVSGGATGTLQNGATVDTANSQLVLDGVNDYAQWTANAVFDVSANWTVELHCNVAAADTGAMIGRGNAGADNFVLYVPGDGSVQLYGNGGWGSPLFTAAAAVNGSEHHFALCRDGGTWRLYRDGVQVASAVAAGAPSNGNDLYVGSGGFDTANRIIAGRIGRVKISNICRFPNGTGFTPPVRTDT